jgi:deazaflavin-dependent oxidoreductase (nitroreductase family)
MSQTPVVPPWVNKTMKSVLRSPVHGLVSKTVLLISFTGRKSGQTYTTPVSYSQTGDQVYVFTHADWWKNLGDDAPVSLRIRGREYRGLAQVVAEDKKTIAARLADHLRKVRSDAGFYKVSFDQRGEPKPEEVEKAVQTVVMLRIRLC